VQERLLERITAMNTAGQKNMIRTWSRSSTVFPEMVGHTIAVHDGAQARPRVHLRADGRAQARRVRTHQDVPRPRGRQGGKGQEVDGGLSRQRSAPCVRRRSTCTRAPARRARHRPHPRPLRARGAHHPRVLRSRDRARHRACAALRRIECGVAARPAVERRRAARRDGVRGRGADAQASPCPRPRQRRSHHEAHMSHHGRARTEPGPRSQLRGGRCCGAEATARREEDDRGRRADDHRDRD